MIDCCGDPREMSALKREKMPDHSLYSQPFRKLLVLQAQISNLFFVFNLLEQFGESICNTYQSFPDQRLRT